MLPNIHIVFIKMQIAKRTGGAQDLQPIPKLFHATPSLPECHGTKVTGDSTRPLIGNPTLFAKSLRDKHPSETSVTIAKLPYLTIVSWPGGNAKRIVALLDQRSA